MGISWNDLKSMHRLEPPRVPQKPPHWSGMKTRGNKNMQNLKFILELLAQLREFAPKTENPTVP
jgi:hypothetical protein